MRRLAICFFAVLLMLPPDAAKSDVLSDAARLEAAGRFREAEAVLSGALSAAGAADRPTLAFELDRLRRIRLDYNLTREKLWRQLDRSIPNVTEPEFERWISRGKFDTRVIDDTLRFLGVSRSNLFWRNPDIAARRRPVENDSLGEHAVLANADAIMQAARLSGTAYVLPIRFAVTMKVSADSGAVPPGTPIRAWLPIPRKYDHQARVRRHVLVKPRGLDRPRELTHPFGVHGAAGGIRRTDGIRTEVYVRQQRGLLPRDGPREGRAGWMRSHRTWPPIFAKRRMWCSPTP